MSQTWKDRLVSWAVWLACVSPLLWFVVQGFTGDLGANPIQYVLRQLGVWALRFICITLAMGPLAKTFKAPVLIRFRRRVGLWAFAYVCLHLSTYIGVDQLFDWPTIGKDIAKRPYITIGMAAFALLVPLAVTSADKLRRRLGPKRWKRLHQAIYLIAPMGVVHYFLLVKADHRPPLVYGAVVLALLAWHAGNWAIDMRKAAERKAAQDAKKAAQAEAARA
ncbi:MAG: sulfite oxidase heme-binding subunit YedZ [Caulobacteraceae bacterium]